MKILLIAIGTRGDVQPFVVIGSRLRTAGHDVHIAAAEGFSEPIAVAGLTHHVLPLDFQNLLNEPDMQAAMTSLSGKLKAYRAAIGIMNVQLSAMWQIGLDVVPDLILYHFKGVLGPYLGHRFGVPAWPVMLQPGFAPTRAYPQFLLAQRSLGGLGNLASHHIINAVMRFGTNRMLKRWVKVTGTDIGPVLDVMAGYAPGRRAPRLHAYSRHIVPLGSDMSNVERQVGYAFAEPATFTPSPALERFLLSGETPIYVGFGSMPGIDHARVNGALLGALQQTGLRAVVATGWGGIGQLAPASHLHVLDAVPHTWLFPRVSAVVHHGGAGTTHEGLRWGQPTVICPLFADQPFFGQRVVDLGAGPAPIAQKRLTADRLARALEDALTDRVAKKAGAMGQAMKTEDGAGAITGLIDQIAIGAN